MIRKFDDLIAKVRAAQPQDKMKTLIDGLASRIDDVHAQASFVGASTMHAAVIADEAIALRAGLGALAEAFGTVDQYPAGYVHSSPTNLGQPYPQGQYIDERGQWAYQNRGPYPGVPGALTGPRPNQPGGPYQSVPGGARQDEYPGVQAQYPNPQTYPGHPGTPGVPDRAGQEPGEIRVSGTGVLGDRDHGHQDHSGVSAGTRTGTTTSGSFNVSGVSPCDDLRAGMSVSGTGIPANTTIARVDGATVILNQQANASGTVSLTFK